MLLNKDIITITDGVIGSSSLQVSDVSEWIAEEVEDGELILSSFSYNSAVAFESGKNLKQFIHEGTGTYWETALANPSIFAKWIVIANGDVGDPVYEALVKERDNAFLDQYELRHRFQHLSVYERRDIPDHFVYVDRNELKIDGKPYKFLGANSYDLLYRSRQEIDETLKSAKEAGIDVIRFWAFGEGFNTAVQEVPGKISQDKLDTLDYIIVAARRESIRLIPVLVNYWGDYGGVPQYLKWADLPNVTPQDIDAFYSSDDVRSIYKYYVENIVGRENKLTLTPYVEESAIFAWELINEPRVSGNASSAALVNWLADMSSYVRSLDESHIILLGHEGFIKGSPNIVNHPGPWLEDISQIEETDVLTHHYYLHLVQDKQDISNSFRHPVVPEWKAYADLVEKPMIIEEVGFSKNATENNGVNRLVLYENLFEETEGHGVHGLILWNWALNQDNNYGISPRDPNDRELIQMLKEYSLVLK